MRIGLDTETFLITREEPFPKNVCLTLSFRNAENKLITNLYDHAEAENLMLDLLEDTDVFWVGQNIAFDFASLLFSYPRLAYPIFESYRLGRVTDTTIRQQLFDIAYGRSYPQKGAEDRVGRYTLSYLWEIIFDEKLPHDLYKYDAAAWRLRYSDLYEVPITQWPEAAQYYAKMDSECCYLIWEEQEKSIGSLGNGILRDDAFQSYRAFCLYLMGATGMMTSETKTEKLKQKVKKEYDLYIPELARAGLISVNKDGSYTKKRQPAIDRIVKACALNGREPLLTKKGQEECSTDLKYVAIDKKAVYWSEDTLLLNLQKMAEAEKILSTYIPVLEQGFDLPICTRFDLAVTGRTTSAAPGNPLVGTNLQNWPRASGPRECFIPREGNLFLSGDFAGTELHTLAQVHYNLFGHSALGEALKTQDVHLVLAANLLGISYEEALHRYQQNESLLIDARQDAKPANFGFPGGMGPQTFIWTYLKDRKKVMGLNDAMSLRAAFMRSWVEMDLYFKYINKLLSAGQNTLELFYSKRLRLVSSYSEACNIYFQALAADGGGLALCEVVRRCYCVDTSALYGCLPVNFIHDELLLEIDKQADLQSIANEFSEVMSDEFNKVVPDSPTNVEPVLSEYWSKKAKSVKKDGKYQIWKE